MTDEDLKKLSEEIVAKFKTTSCPQYTRLIESALHKVRSETIEECAKICDARGEMERYNQGGPSDHLDWLEGSEAASLYLAEQIRAQKEKQ